MTYLNTITLNPVKCRFSTDWVWWSHFTKLWVEEDLYESIISKITGPSDFLVTFGDLIKMLRAGVAPILTHFMWLVSFCTPWKHQKIKGFLMFSGGIERASGMKWENRSFVYLFYLHSHFFVYIPFARI